MRGDEIGMEIIDFDLQRIAAGDERECRAVMEQYGTMILRNATLLLRDPHLAEDVTQETFLRAFRSIRQYEGRGTLNSWLLKIACNLCRSRMRKQAWKRLIFMGDAPYAEDAVSSDESQESIYLRQEIRAIIGQIPYKYREVIVLHYYQQWSIAEICEHLGEREGTVKSRLSRGRQLCKEFLAQGGWNSEQIG